MRGGINESYRRDGIYMKPIIWQYFKQQGINWEKRLIKKKFNVGKLTRQTVQHQNSFEPKNNPVTFDAENYRLIKDLFGFATDEEAWQHEYGFTISKSHPDIDRFMSPVLFKPIMSNQNICRVYLDAAEIPAEMLDQSKEFEIKNSNRQSFKIKTPAAAFDFYKFFDFMLNKIVLEDITVNYNENNRSVRILEQIYLQLKNNR